MKQSVLTDLQLVELKKKWLRYLVASVAHIDPDGFCPLRILLNAIQPIFDCLAFIGWTHARHPTLKFSHDFVDCFVLSLQVVQNLLNLLRSILDVLVFYYSGGDRGSCRSNSPCNLIEIPLSLIFSSPEGNSEYGVNSAYDLDSYTIHNNERWPSR